MGHRRLVRYLLTKAGWYLGALVAALVLNFLLPRLLPGSPVDAIVSQLSQGGAQGESVKRIHEAYVAEFALDRPLWEQFFVYLGNLLQGDLGVSFTLYPQKVETLIGQTLPWSIALQLPAILIGWIVGNVLGAVAAYKGGWFDRGAFVGSLLLNAVPYYCLGILFVYVFAVALPIFPASGGWSFGRAITMTPGFFVDALHHGILPFLSLVVVFIGGQAVGMRSMAIYELGADYVSFARGFGIRDRKVVGYIFRNGMLPQVTGLALSIGTLVGGALITEIIFSYPGIGSLLFSAIRQNDYPVIQGITLLITLLVLFANFAVEVAYGFIDPRIRASRAGER